jgi:DNA gyrase subunit A
VSEDDEVLVIMGKGNIVRMPVSPVTRRGRNTQGMKFANPGHGDSVVALARNPERAVDEVDEDAVPAPGATPESDSTGVDAVPSSGNEQVATEATETPETPESDATGGSE